MNNKIFSIFILFSFNLIISITCYANTPLRIFQAIDGKELIFLQKLAEDKKSDKFLFLLKNSQLPENDKAFLFKETNSRWVPVNESVNLVFIDSNRKTLVKGTLKSELLLAGIKKDLRFYELSKTKEPYPNLQGLYNDQEGQNYKSDSNINKKVEEVLKTKCNAAISINMDKTFEVSTYKVIAATQGLSDLCSDDDFKEAIQNLKKIEFKSTSKNPSPKVSLKKSLLIIDLGTSSENTFHHIKALSSKVL